MKKMRRHAETGLFFLWLLSALLFLFRDQWTPGHSLFLSQIEDPAPRFSFFPWDHLAARQFHQGHFPLWNPYSGAGMPLIANYQSAVFFPLKWPYYLHPSLRLLDLMVVMRLALAGSFTFLLGRALGLKRLGAFLSGTAFALSGYFMKHLTVVNVNSEIWLPLLLYFLHLEIRRGPRFRRTIFSGLVWGGTLCGGSPEAAFYVVVTVGLFALASRRPRLIVAGFFAPLCLGGLLAAAQVLPFLEYLPWSWHLHDPALHLLGRFPARTLVSLAAPWLLGPSGSHPAQILCAPYAGVVLLVLALLGAFHYFFSRSTAFAVGLVVLFLAFVYHLPPLSFLTYLPALNRVAHAKFALSPAFLFLSLLAGRGLELSASGKLQGKKSALALALAGLFLLAGTFYSRWQFKFVAPAGFVPPLLALLAAGGMVSWGLSRNRRRLEGGGKKPAVALAGLAVLELLFLFSGFRLNSRMPAEVTRFPDPAVPEALQMIKQDPTFPRFTGLAGALHHNLNLLYEVSDLRAFDGMYPRSYVQVMGEIENFPLAAAAENFMSHGWSFDVRPENLAHPRLDELGVKFIVSREAVSAPGWLLIQKGTYRVFRNQESFPRAWVEREERGEGSPAERTPASLKNYTFDRVELSSVGPGWLILADTYFPGWRAEVNGRGLALRPFHNLFREICLPPGPCLVTMTYQPWAFRIGLFTSLTGLLAALGWGMVGRRKGTRGGETEVQGR